MSDLQLPLPGDATVERHQSERDAEQVGYAESAQPTGPAHDAEVERHAEVDRDVTPKSTVTSEPEPLCIGSVPADKRTKKGDALDQVVEEILSRPPVKVDERTGFADGSPIVKHTGLLGEVATLMMRTGKSEQDLLIHTMGRHLLELAEAHCPNNHEWGCCDQCAYGDTPWPCADWLGGMRVAVSWLYKRAGLEL